MTLGRKQRVFARLVARLIEHAYQAGYEITLGEAYRTPEQAAANAAAGRGISNSLHTRRLAIDLNLFVDGQYQTSSEAHRPLGEFWESLSTSEYACCWGGRFGDGNHYSIEDGGVR